MASGKKIPKTRALRLLEQWGVDYELFDYRYEPRGGTRVASRELGVDEHLFVKTLIFETPDKSPLIVLMHGDMEVSTKNLARRLGVREVVPCRPETASRHSGYMVGGTSPFGTRKAMPVFAEASIFELERIFINAGKRGLMLRLAPAVIRRLPDVKEVCVGVQLA